MSAESRETDRERRFPLTEVAVMIGLVAIVGVFFLAMQHRTYERSYGVVCACNLKQIYGAAMEYSDRKGTHLFPIASGQSPRAHESLNEMLSADPGSLPPSVFVCPAGEALAAVADPKGCFVLDASTLSYAWTSRRPKHSTANLTLASDKYFKGYDDSAGVHEGHPDGVNVLFMDNHVEFVQAKDLPPDTGLPDGLTR